MPQLLNPPFFLVQKLVLPLINAKKKITTFYKEMPPPTQFLSYAYSAKIQSLYIS